MFAVVKHGARRPERHAVIGGALLVEATAGHTTPGFTVVPWGARASGPSPRSLSKQGASRSCVRPIGTARYSPPAVCRREVSASFWTALGTASPQSPITCDFIGTWTVI